MNKQLFIYHYNPIELYPPIINFLDFLSNSLGKDWDVLVFTTYASSSVEPYSIKSDNIQIIRKGTGFKRGKQFQNLWSLICFNVYGILQLAVNKVRVIMYYETSSALPVIVGKLLMRKSSELYIHYHEYMSAMDYSRTRFQSYIHSKEMSLYDSADWVSHTNPKRMELFLKDIGRSKLPGAAILPNYPPALWQIQARNAVTHREKIRFVFVGSIEEKTSYIREFLTWLTELEMTYSFDIYTQSDTRNLQKLIADLRIRDVTVQGYVKNSQLPGLLSSYHIGLILYKGTETNVVYSAPNKLFEYLACGLDVWVDNAIQGVRPYYTNGVFPKVIPVEYANLSSYDSKILISRVGLKSQPFTHTAEEEYKRLVERFAKHT